MGNKQIKSSNNLVNVSGATKVALNGYDPISFFEDKPANGDFKITSKYQGATYYFTSKDHKKLFDSNPAKYAPKYGGFCAFGVSVGALLPVDVKTAQVYKDKLYINLNSDVLEMFNKDLDSIIAKADKNWPTVANKNM